ncbi:hypothetical protein [Streptomyces sp. NPDC058424]|uniref:hypothetical protein n=1 Tax=Streptomyces sp. NPDC058424 TaxID=3346491 RepID=UPI003651E22E
MHEPEDDVKITKCSSADNLAGFPQAELTIENHDSRSRSYMVQVEFVDGSGTRSSEGVAMVMVNNLAAGGPEPSTTRSPCQSHPA